MHKKQLFDTKKTIITPAPRPPAPKARLNEKTLPSPRLFVWLGIICAELHMLPAPHFLL